VEAVHNIDNSGALKMYIALFYDGKNKLRQTPKASSLKALHQRISLFTGTQHPSSGLVQVVKTKHDGVEVLGSYVFTQTRLTRT
jgi:hypothetical protein